VDGWTGLSNTSTTMVSKKKVSILIMPELTSVSKTEAISESLDSLMYQLKTVITLLLPSHNNQSLLPLMHQPSNSTLVVSLLGRVMD